MRGGKSGRRTAMRGLRCRREGITVGVSFRLTTCQQLAARLRRRRRRRPRAVSVVNAVEPNACNHREACCMMVLMREEQLKWGPALVSNVVCVDTGCMKIGVAALVICHLEAEG